jgi:hypothetical protein
LRSIAKYSINPLLKIHHSSPDNPTNSNIKERRIYFKAKKELLFA